MSNIKLISINGEPNPEDKKVLVEGLLVHHASQGHPRKSENFSILLKDEDSKVFGGVIVTFLWNSMEINALWVDETVRKQGWASKLMQEVENEAVKRGCTIAYTNTFSWQASGLYEKLGYKLFGKLYDFPQGSSLSYYYKKLIK